MLNRLMELCALDGVSGTEDAVRAYIRAQAAPFADEIREDSTGNLLVFKRGKKSIGKTVVLTAHMDEVGLIVKSVTDEGYLKFGFIGSMDRRVIIGKRVRVGDRKIKGIIGIKAYHMVSREEEKNVPKTEDMYIDIGAADKQAALGLVSPGDTAAFDIEPELFGEGLLKAKAIDDRVGCAALLKLIEEGPSVDTWFVFTVMEEVGGRGAFGATFALKPDIALIVEGTTAADIPEVEAHKRVCAVGGGVVLPFMDRGTIYDRGVFEGLRSLAQEKNIPWQLKSFVSGGTDASSVQRSGAGTRVGAAAAAVRYIHCPTSVVSIEDTQALYALVKEFVKKLGENEHA